MGVTYGQFWTSNLPDAGDAETSDRAVSQDQNDIATFWMPASQHPVFLSDGTFIEPHAVPLSKVAYGTGNRIEHAVKPFLLGWMHLGDHR
jgi:hypothetical protein